MNPNRSNRRVHSPEFKAQILGECQQPNASVAAVAVAHGLNPNVVRKWLAGLNLKRMGAAMPVSVPRTPALQFVPVELAKPDDVGIQPPPAEGQGTGGRAGQPEGVNAGIKLGWAVLSIQATTASRMKFHASRPWRRQVS